jgi:hypothetical protein
MLILAASSSHGAVTFVSRTVAAKLGSGARDPPFWVVSKESVKYLLAAHNWII